MNQPEHPLPMRSYRLIFSTPDRDGNEVRLTESQWRGHILDKRPDMEPYIEEIQDVIRNPEIVRLGDDDDYRLARSGVIVSMPSLYLRVVVIYSDEVTGRRLGSVRTAHLSRRPPVGKDIT